MKQGKVHVCGNMLKRTIVEGYIIMDNTFRKLVMKKKAYTG